MKRKKSVGALLTVCILLASGCSRIEENKDVSKTEQRNRRTIRSRQTVMAYLSTHVLYGGAYRCAILLYRYHGTVSPDEFDETVLSQVEKDNILAIKRAEEIYKAEHPSPKEYKEGNIVEEDLDGDGQPEQLQYILEDLEYHTYTGRIIINGQEFIVEDYEDVWLDNPRLKFYVTDISPQYKGLEIAIMDNGPSEDR